MNALQYHLELTEDEREEIYRWLISEFGDDGPMQIMWGYEVIGEGLVRFTKIIREPHNMIGFESYTKRTATPPPLP